MIRDVIETIISNVEANIGKGKFKEVSRDSLAEIEVDVISEELASLRKDLEPEEQERCLEKGEISHNETSEHPQTEEKMVLDRKN